MDWLSFLSFVFLVFIWQNMQYIILFFIILAAFLFSPLGSRFTNINAVDESVIVRADLIKTSILMTQHSPIFGVGLNNFLQNVSYFSKNENQSLFLNLQPVHNIFLLILSQTGVIGFGFFIWFLVKTHLRIMNY